MNHIPFWTKLKIRLKNYLNNGPMRGCPVAQLLGTAARAEQQGISASALAIIVAVTFLYSCSARDGLWSPPKEDAQLSQVQKEIVYSTVTPPWKVWQEGEVREQELNYAETFEKRGELKEAFDRYQIVEKTSQYPMVRDTALLYKLNIALKQGQSQRVLDELIGYVKNNDIPETKIPPRFALLAVYSYYHQKKFDQCFAWLNVLFRSVDGVDKQMHEAATRTLELLVSTLPQADFPAYKTRWERISYFTTALGGEGVRRMRGGLPRQNEVDWFDIRTYSSTVKDSQAVVELLPAYSGRKISELPDYSVAAVIPLTGRHAKLGEAVKNGIDLAMDVYFADSRPPMVYYTDSAVYDPPPRSDSDDANAAAHVQYVPEVRVHSASRVILGPLDIRATEALAKERYLTGIPYISFARREKITEAGPTCFRLGVTASNQVAELVSYAVRVQKFGTFSVFYPDNESGRELSELFNAYVTTLGGEVVSSNAYNAKNISSMRDAFQRAGTNLGEAVFIADAPDDAKSLINNIKKRRPGTVFLGTALWNDRAVISALGNALEGAIFVTPFYFWSERPQVKDFIREYRKKYYTDPDIISAQAYDATNLVLNIFANDSRASGDFLGALREAKTLQGVTGLLQVYPNREINRRMTVLQVQNGEIREVMVDGRKI